MITKPENASVHQIRAGERRGDKTSLLMSVEFTIFIGCWFSYRNAPGYSLHDLTGKDKQTDPIETGASFLTWWFACSVVRLWIPPRRGFKRATCSWSSWRMTSKLFPARFFQMWTISRGPRSVCSILCGKPFVRSLLSESRQTNNALWMKINYDGQI